MQALFNFLSCTAVATAKQMSAGNALQSTLMVMGAHGVILPLLIYAFMPISGAHFNPMVTFSMVAAGRQACGPSLICVFTPDCFEPASLHKPCIHHLWQHDSAK